MEFEIYLPIPGFEKFEVSNRGVVRYAATKAIKPQRANVARGGKLYYKFDIDRVKAKKTGNRSHITFFVHAAVLLAFQGPRPSPEHHGCHFDDLGGNNFADNLCWGTPTENMRMKKSWREAHSIPLFERGDSWECPKSAWEFYQERVAHSG
jgi:hypothetical protein